MTDRRLPDLEAPATLLGQILARPKLILGIAAAAGLGWIGLAAAHVLHVFTPSAHGWGLADYGAATLMWCAMSLAMMLPSAG
ncbi:MAG: hypothetical protein ACREBP_10875, partial [Sphingomicrobium sp.]